MGDRGFSQIITTVNGKFSEFYTTAMAQMMVWKDWNSQNNQV